MELFGITIAFTADIKASLERAFAFGQSKADEALKLRIAELEELLEKAS